MATQNVQNAIKNFLKNLKGTISFSEVLLFGSRTKQKHRKGSDIDLMVVSDDFAKMSEEKRLDVLFQASQFIEPEIHPWAVTREELSKAHKQTLLASIRDRGINVSSILE